MKCGTPSCVDAGDEFMGLNHSEFGRHTAETEELQFCCKFIAHGQKSTMRSCIMVAADGPELSPVIASPSYLVAVSCCGGGGSREFSDHSFEGFGGPP